MKGFIYIIRTHQSDDVYYGSTTQMLCKRMATHRACYKKWLNGRGGFTSSYNILKYEDAYTELIEEVEFQNKQELFAREGHHIRENNCVNKRIAGRTNKEWTQDNKDHVAETMKQYYATHKAEIAEYREANKERIAEFKKKYVEANRDKINEKQRQRRASKLG